MKFNLLLIRFSIIWSISSSGSFEETVEAGELIGAAATVAAGEAVAVAATAGTAGIAGVKTGVNAGVTLVAASGGVTGGVGGVGAWPKALRLTRVAQQKVRKLIFIMVLLFMGCAGGGF